MELVMYNLNYLGLSDGMIKSINLFNGTVEIIIEKWNSKILKLTFEECWTLKDRQSVNKEIGSVEILHESELLDELIKDILAGGGTKDEIKSAVQVTFYEPWDLRIILEIIADSVKFEEM